MREGENTTQNLSSCHKVILRRNIIIETTNKIINKQGKRHNCDKYLLHIFVASLSCGIISMSILRFGGFEHMKIKTFLHQNIHYIILKSAMT